MSLSLKNLIIKINVDDIFESSLKTEIKHKEHLKKRYNHIIEWEKNIKFVFWL